MRTVRNHPVYGLLKKYSMANKLPPEHPLSSRDAFIGAAAELLGIKALAGGTVEVSQ
jgi:hypothetical protein